MQRKNIVKQQKNKKRNVVYKHDVYNDDDDYDKLDDSMEYAYDNYRYDSNNDDDSINDFSDHNDNNEHQQSKNRKRNVKPKK